MGSHPWERCFLVEHVGRERLWAPQGGWRLAAPTIQITGSTLPPGREPKSLGHGQANQHDPQAQGPADQLLCKNCMGSGNGRSLSL